jgi:hypothetical protein
MSRICFETFVGAETLTMYLNQGRSTRKPRNRTSLGDVHSDPSSDELLAPTAGATGVTDGEGEKAADHHATQDW